MTILQDYLNQNFDLQTNQENVSSNSVYAASRIAQYALPEGVLTRLRQDHDWSQSFTLAAVEEYRRFVFLAMTAPHQVTPSRIVDEVWHTHLMFTRDYWDRFVPLLPQPLHHEPGNGRPGDAAHFAEQYRRTLELYKQTFGEVAPSHLWPTTGQAPLSTLDDGQATARRPAGWWLLPFVLALLGGLLAHSLFIGGVILVVGVLLMSFFWSSHSKRIAENGSSCGGGALFMTDPASNDWDGGGGTDSCDSSGGDGGSSCGGGGCGGGGCGS